MFEDAQAASSTVVDVVAQSRTAQTDDSSARVVKLIVGILIVMGLISLVLTWRYWVHTNPRLGRSTSRAKLPKGAGTEGGEPTPSPGVTMHGAAKGTASSERRLGNDATQVMAPVERPERVL